MKKILLYFGEKEQKEGVINFLEKEEIAYKVVDDASLQSTISSILFDENTLQNTNIYPFNFALFAHFTKDELFALLQKMKENNVQISHKAMLNQNNIQWTLQVLLEEIKEEQEYMEAYTLTQKLLKEANDTDFEIYSEESFALYRNSFLKAYLAIKQKKPTYDELNALNKEMIETRNNLKVK